MFGQKGFHGDPTHPSTALHHNTCGLHFRERSDKENEISLKLRAFNHLSRHQKSPGFAENRRGKMGAS